jgi:hypothetical protein
MAELILEPYSVVQHWTIGQPGVQPEVVLKDYLEALAVNCLAAEGCVIGHIKALALFPNKEYLRVSVVAAHLPATIDGAAPPDCAGLEVTLNVLVYGLTRSQVEEITLAAKEALTRRHPLQITMARTHQEGAHE